MWDAVHHNIIQAQPYPIFPRIHSHLPGMVQAWVGQKLLKSDILRVFQMSNFINIKEIIGKDTS